MLTTLTINNIVLIEQLTLDAAAGLSALTGETGAGKSILLDALGLALGGRADAGLVRHGAEQASVAAAFDLPVNHPALLLATEQGLSVHDGSLILRRSLSKDGRSKAFINDAPVTVQVLRMIGAQLVEIHGQFETQGLMDASTHGATLDAFAGLTGEAKKLGEGWAAWRKSLRELEDAKVRAETARQQEDYLTFTVAELDRLAPESGEEDALAAKRQRLLAREKLRGAFAEGKQIIEGEGGLVTLAGRLQMQLDRLQSTDPATVTPMLEALARAKSEIEDISWQIDRLESGKSDNADDGRLEDVEERYFALKACAKKHRTTIEGLIDLHADLAQKLRLITHQDEEIASLESAVAKARDAFLKQAEVLSAKRIKAAEKLAKAVNAELPDLRLDKARFAVRVTPDTEKAGADGIDDIQFMVSTNPQTPPAGLDKIASGGELSRFMLALKVILAEGGSVPTLIFDEADSGIGGATADAVGERLQRLARKYQVLAVTHSPQVAARARHHLHVAKQSAVKGKKDAALLTTITMLSDAAARAEEIARMLSGAEITPEARAQAARLLDGQAKADAA